MAKRKRPPKYGRHKGRNLARVVINGQHIYLGEYDSPESWREYAEIVERWQRGEFDEGLQPAHSNGERHPLLEPTITVGKLTLQFWDFARDYYASRDGSENGRTGIVRTGCKLMNGHFQHIAVDDIGPLKLKTARDTLIERAHCRKYINDIISQIVTMFAWGVENELVAPGTVAALREVKALRKGKTNARESAPVDPVSDEDLAATIAAANTPISDMLRLQRLTGARPGEIRLMRGEQIVQMGGRWFLDTGDQHKTSHHGKARVIPLNAEAIAIIDQYHTGLSTDKYLFTTGTRPNIPYDKDSYGQAVRRASKRAGVPQFGPNRIRHTVATYVVESGDLEAAAVLLGHASTATTRIYAKRSMQRAADVADKLG